MSITRLCAHVCNRAFKDASLFMSILKLLQHVCLYYEGRTESHEQQFFSCELGTADEGE